MDNLPLYRKIMRKIENIILEKNLKQKDKIMSTNSLAEKYNASPATVRKAVELLIAKDILSSKQGKGVFITSNAKEKIIKYRKKEFNTKIKELTNTAKLLNISENKLLAKIRENY